MTAVMVRLPIESLVMAIAYADRVVTLTGLTILPHNWRRLMFASLILAAKVLEDAAVWMSDFLPLFPSLNQQSINMLERGLLSALEYRVSVKASLYAAIYFELRAHKGDQLFSFTA